MTPVTAGDFLSTRRYSRSLESGKGQGKRAMPTAGCSVSHPDYRQTTIYINKQIEKRMKAAFLEDEVEDFSQWIEERIEEWLKGRKQG